MELKLTDEELRSLEARILAISVLISNKDPMKPFYDQMLQIISYVKEKQNETCR